MFRLTLILALLLAPLALADTLADRLADIQAVTQDAVITSDPAPVPDTDDRWRADITYTVESGAVGTRNTVALLGTGYDSGAVEPNDTGTWVWERRLPEPLRVEDKYLESRTANGWADLSKDAQETAIHGFSSDAWRTVGGVAGTADIREFTVQAVDGSTVKVGGLFDLGTGTWERRSYFIHLVDPDGSVDPTNANVEFERVTL